MVCLVCGVALRCVAFCVLACGLQYTEQVHFSQSVFGVSCTVDLRKGFNTVLIINMRAWLEIGNCTN